MKVVCSSSHAFLYTFCSLLRAASRRERSLRVVLEEIWSFAKASFLFPLFFSGICSLLAEKVEMIYKSAKACRKSKSVCLSKHFPKCHHHPSSSAYSSSQSLCRSRIYGSLARRLSTSGATARDLLPPRRRFWRVRSTIS